MPVPDEPFDAGEPLYRRCLPDDIDSDGGLSPHSIDLPGCSVNRGAERFGPPENVLLGDLTLGIAEFNADNLPGPMEIENDRYEFVLKHDGRDDNPAHSEVRVTKNGNYNKRRIFPAERHSALAYELSEKASIIRLPTRTP